jgi:hypothetical protein
MLENLLLSSTSHMASVHGLTWLVAPYWTGKIRTSWKRVHFRRQIVHEILSQKSPKQNRAGGVAQVIEWIECLPKKA